MHWGIGFWPLFPIIGIGLFLYFCWNGHRWSNWAEKRKPVSVNLDEPSRLNALEILRQRYARGDIDDTTFERMREHLEPSGKPHE